MRTTKSVMMTGIISIVAVIAAMLPATASFAAGTNLNPASGVSPTSAFANTETTLTVTDNLTTPNTIGAGIINGHTWSTDAPQNAGSPTLCQLVSQSNSTAVVKVAGPNGSQCGFKVKTLTSTAGYNDSTDFKFKVTVVTAYTVTYNAEGGTVFPSSDSFSGTALTLPTPTWAGYTFSGWFTLASGGVQRTSPYTPTATETLFAQWTTTPRTVTLNAEGGSVSSPTQTYTGTPLTLLTPTRSNYTFAGWFTLASGGVQRTSPYAPAADETLHAHWTANIYTVTLNPNGGAVDPTTMDFTYGGTALTLPTPVWASHYFVGWFDGDTKVSNSYSPTTSITLGARWAAVTIDTEHLNNFKAGHYYTSDVTTTISALSNYVGSGVVTYNFRITGHGTGTDPKCEPFSASIPNSTDGKISYTITPDPKTSGMKVGRGCDMVVDLYVDGTKVASSSTYHIYYGPNPYAKVPTVTATGHDGTVGADFTPITPTSTLFACQEGGYTGDFAYTIDPTLPRGLSMDPETGEITGTPSETSSDVTYTITSNCGEQDAQTTIHFKVVGDPKLAASATDGKVGTEFTDVTPVPSNFVCQSDADFNDEGGPSFGYSISPTLPRDLSIDSDTGVISGMSREATGDVTYTITASCGGETKTVDVTFAIDADPKLAASATDGKVGTEFTDVTPVPTNFSCQTDPNFEGEGGPSFGYTISPTLPRDLSIDSDTGVISGMPLEATGDVTYTITASCGGETKTVDVTFAIDADPKLDIDEPNEGIVDADEPIVPITVDPSDYTCQSDPTFNEEGGPSFLFTISPALPTGLTIDPATGEITGTPTVATVNTTYTITGACGTESKTVTFDLIVNGLAQSVNFTGDNFLFGSGTWTIVSPATATNLGDGEPTITYSIVDDERTTATGCAITPEGVLTYTSGGSCYVVATAAPIGRYNQGVSAPVEMRAWVEGDITETVLNPLGYTLLTGSGFTPGGLVRLELHSTVYFLKNVYADANGNVSAYVQMPLGAALGDHHVWMIDLGGSLEYSGQEGFYIVKLPVKIVAGVAALPNTGLNGLPALLLAGGLISIGALASIYFGRRRKKA